MEKGHGRLFTRTASRLVRYGSTTSSEITTGRLDVIPTPLGPGIIAGPPVGNGAPAHTSQPGCIGWQGIPGAQGCITGAAIAGCRGGAPTNPGGGWPKHRSYFQTSIAMYFSLSDLQPLVAAAATSRIGIHAAIRGRCHIVVISVSPGLKGHL